MAIGGSASAGWTICFGVPTSMSRQSSRRLDRCGRKPASWEGVPPSAADEGYQRRASELTNVMQRGLWWQTAVIYQIYPRSFQDSNYDGIGDLRGITRRLPYLVELGVDAVWLSPIFRSPMADFGYDISDYADIDPVFGTLDDLDRLVADAHDRDIRVVLDWVPNHTSDQHAWFASSRSSRSSEHRDWYVWREG